MQTLGGRSWCCLWGILTVACLIWGSFVLWTDTGTMMMPLSSGKADANQVTRSPTSQPASSGSNSVDVSDNTAAASINRSVAPTLAPLSSSSVSDAAVCSKVLRCATCLRRNVCGSCEPPLVLDRGACIGHPSSSRGHSPCPHHYCFFVSVWERHGDELTTLLWNIYSQRGASNTSVILWSWTEHAGVHDEWLSMHMSMFPPGFIHAYVDRSHDPRDTWGMGSHNRALDFAQQHLPFCSRYAFTQSHNLYAANFLQATCQVDADLVFVPFSAKGKTVPSAMNVFGGRHRFPAWLNDGSRALNHADYGSAVVVAGCVNDTRFPWLSPSTGKAEALGDGYFWNALMDKGCSVKQTLLDEDGILFLHQ